MQGVLRPVTSRHGDLQPPATLVPSRVADLDARTSHNGIKLLRSPCHLVAGTAADRRSAGGPMGMGASSQSRKRPRSPVAGLTFKQGAEKTIYWQIKKDFKRSRFLAGTGGASSRRHPAPCQNDVPGKQDEKRGATIQPQRPEVGARSCPALRFLSSSAAAGSGLAHSRGLICSCLPGGKEKGDGGR